MALSMISSFKLFAHKDVFYFVDKKSYNLLHSFEVDISDFPHSVNEQVPVQRWQLVVMWDWPGYVYISCVTLRAHGHIIWWM